MTVHRVGIDVLAGGAIAFIDTVAFHGKTSPILIVGLLLVAFSLLFAAVGAGAGLAIFGSCQMTAP